ncbi:Peroxidasin [Trachymyrmex septentrionalis]|uniref:Peroxidasin n=1 Tax=Trachymyrmex septentrionalis TaxID=34720 RepID=A0A195FH13_9HYME|nr:PREDICTED: peroxidasin [Trachymyrmex septentrionalis]KYN39975.1 Peroxidasin [Trachymyrmex septentrionalis]
MRRTVDLLVWTLLVPSLLFASDPLQQATGATVECPQKCVCYNNTMQVRCMFLKLIQVPRVPANVTVLDLRFNSIAEVRGGSFHGHNQLHTLLLNDNHIRRLPIGAFEGAPNLRILYLYKNRIEHIAPGAFAGLPRLEQLYLHHNHLREIRPGTFNNLPALERLFLHSNKLHRLPANAFVNVGPMTRLRLDSNALICDCNLVWLVERLQDKPTEMAAICQSPHEMKGRSLTTMLPEDFHCTKPRIVEGPEDTVVRFGDTITLTCRVTGDPTPKIKWMKNTRYSWEADDDDEKYVVIREDGEKYVIREDGTLVIFGTTEQDGGIYECVASSDMGSAKSRKARAVITAASQLILAERPESQNVTAGTNVTFSCRALGNPRPDTRWFRDGRSIPFNDRISLENDGTLLRILAVKETDAGKYECYLRSTDHTVHLFANLSVVDLTAPRLLFRPQDIEVELNAIVEVPCRAEGIPKPVIQWKKDGSALEGNRVKITRGGSLLIFNVTPQDSGRYECSAINDYGRATGDALVRVRQPGATDTLVIRAFQSATEEIDRAINKTLSSLFNSDGSSKHVDPFRLTRFPNAIDRAAARPAELFERTLINIRRMVDTGNKANVTGEFRYEEILTAEQVKKIERLSGCTGHRRRQNCTNRCFHHKYRAIDGSCNNLRHSTWGSSHTGFRRVLQPIYENGFSMPVGWEKGRRYYGYPKPAARLVSTTVISTHAITSDDQISHMVMQWGQFLDHDLDHALPSVSSESWDGIDCKKSCDNAAPCFPMEVPPGDPRISNRRCIDFIRSSAVCGSGATSILWGGLTPREQLNQLTSYLDASQVYGYDDELARDLRDFTTDRGLLREGPTLPGHKSLLPYASGQFVDCRRNPLESSINCFVAGDIRANEQVGLLAMHTLWLREHNRIARALREMNPHWNGEKLYQEARRIVGAEMQHITYRHWLPRIFGSAVEDSMLGPYRGYDPNVDASISNVFATAALRFGHSLIQPRLERLNASFQPIPQGPLNLRDAFFAPWRLVEEGGVDPLIRGMYVTAAKLKLPEQNLNVELTEQLFRTAHAVALDLAAMNIQRGRDHGLPGYVEWRDYCNMSRVETFEHLNNDISSARVRQKLRELYGHPGNIDVWVGGILEDQLPGMKVGPLFKCLLLEQFRRTRDGDRFWYENPSVFRAEQLVQIQQVSLARILCDNGDNITRIQPNVFLLPESHNDFVSCDEIPYVDLNAWSDCCENCEDRDNTISRVRREAEKYFAPSRDYVKDTDSLSREEEIEYFQRMFGESNREAKRLQQQFDNLLQRIKKLELFFKDIKTQ